MRSNIASSLTVDYGYVGLSVSCKVSKNGAALASIAGTIVDNEDETYTINFTPEDRNATNLMFKVSAVGMQDKIFYENTSDGNGVYAIPSTSDIKTELEAEGGKLSEIESVTSKFRFTVDNQVDANSLTIVGGSVDEGAIANAVALSLSGKSVIYTSPTTKTGDVEIFTASDYNSIDVLALTWSLTSATDLTNADVRFKCENLSKTAVVTNPNGATKTITIELTNAETALLSPGNYDYYIEAIINGRILPPLITGKLIVKSK